MAKPFDPTKPVLTRDGHPARILCADVKYPDGETIVAALLHADGETVKALRSYFSDGRYTADGDSHIDLVNVPEIGYIVVWEYHNGNTFVCTEIFRSVNERDAYIRRIKAGPRAPVVHSVHEIPL